MTFNQFMNWILMCRLKRKNKKERKEKEKWESSNTQREQ